MSYLEFCMDRSLPIVSLDIREAFNNMSEREKLYAHYLSKASYYGSLIVLVQTSRESPNIFRLIHRIFVGEKLEDLKISALKSEISEEDFDSFLAFCIGFYSNMGNYKGFGDTKIVPELSADKFYTLVQSSQAYKTSSKEIDAIWKDIKDDLYLLNSTTKQLGFDGKGVSTYLSKNIQQKDSDLINKFFKEHKLEGYNNRLFKTEKSGKTFYEIRNAGIESKTVLEIKDFEGVDIKVTSGDYSQLLELVNQNLTEAEKYASNENEKNMIYDYIKSFRNGDLDAHKNGSRHWIKNKSPAVESYIGFIETYRDPVGMRGEFEGFVAMVNKVQSAKFQKLVSQAEKFIKLLPWSVGFEKDQFLRPDFTSLDVLTFAGSGVPIGINIPNYDEIRQSEGFKNVNLGNVITSRFKSKKPSSFVSKEDDKLIKELVVSAEEVQVGLHELLGHGSGKLLRKNEDGSHNFPSSLINPMTNEPVSKWYDVGETYDSKFTNLGSSYEECRAECVGLYLCMDTEVLKVFGIEDSRVIYVNWLYLLISALKGIEMFSPASNEWKQAHSEARFVILQVLLEAGEGLVSVKEITGEDGKPDLLLTLDINKIETVGKKAIGDFLQKLQILKSTGDIKEARALYEKYNAITPCPPTPWAKWRDIIVNRRQPRMILAQANTTVENEKLTLTEYEGSKESYIRSWAERFNPEMCQKIDQVLAQLVEKDKPYF